MIFNVLDYGARSGGKELCTNAIQSAVDACEKAGGGRVVVPAGKFLTGTIYLKDNVELHLEFGATLIASTDLNDYNDINLYPQNSSSEVELWWGKHLILALEKNNVALTGYGVIDGNAEYFYEVAQKYSYMNGYLWRDGFASAKDKTLRRPGQLVCFIECNHVRLDSVTVKNATCWSYFFHGCEYVQIHGVKVFNDKCHANTDGIDVDCCRFVTISDCIIDTGDDSLAIRCNSKRIKNPKPCEFITVTNCCFSASVCGIRFGVGQGIIRHVKVSNLVMEHAGVPILIQTRYGNSCLADMYDIDITNVSCFDAGYPFRILAPVGSVKQVSLSNMRVNCVASAKIIADGDGKIEDITIKDVDMKVLNEPEGTVMNESKLLERGLNAVEIENTLGVRLKNVKVYGDGLSGFSNILKENNNERLEIIDCNL